MTGFGSNRGAALVLVLLLVIALTLVANGTLYLARRELEVARASVRDLRRRLAAEGAVRGALAGWPEEAALLAEGASMAGGSFDLGLRVVSVVTIRRLGRELYLVEGEGRQQGWPGRSRAGRLVWVVEPEAVLERFGAVARVGGSVRLLPGSRVDGFGVTDPPPGWEPVCDPLSDELGGLFPGGTLPPLERIAVEPEPFPGAGKPLLGPLRARDLVPSADLVPPTSVTPGPSIRLGACAVEDPANWGSPGDPTGPCGGHLPLIVTPGDLVIRGGEGQGALVVGGSLRLAAGARFRGLVLVAGDLAVESEGLIYGLVRVGGGLELLDRARIVGSGCPALRALREAEGLDAATPLPGRSWISPL